MKIAVNYENGEIFQHFGQTKTFKVYTVENGTITGTELVPGAPEGHHALGHQLAAMQVDGVICGRLGIRPDKGRPTAAAYGIGQRRQRRFA